ncbi:membrane spanning protein [Gracilibacillus halophilus YIM-C55.5]|uniref:Membrane spanning protein n=1 Tax=Gracilibacillus halophilus YIM-C55.5 TaxID=1308866 RepID=N4W6B1_9BACI|nr:DUF2512 family protein [Gracilibacillus halophilus]ENH95748.1 membrane spanning protein [Gracilibacillus halophilus YIM-C55.5]
MISLIVKLITLPIVVFIASTTSNQFYISSIWQGLLLVGILALVGIAMELAMLSKVELLFSVALDFMATFVIVYVLTSLLTNAYVTFVGAVLLSIVIAGCEWFLHRFLVKGNQKKKAVT